MSKNRLLIFLLLANTPLLHAQRIQGSLCTRICSCVTGFFKDEGKTVDVSLVFQGSPFVTGRGHPYDYYIKTFPCKRRTARLTAAACYVVGAVTLPLVVGPSGIASEDARISRASAVTSGISLGVALALTQKLYEKKD